MLRRFPLAGGFCEIRESEWELMDCVVLGSRVADVRALGAIRRLWFLRFNFHIY